MAELALAGMTQHRSLGLSLCTRLGQTCSNGRDRDPRGSHKTQGSSIGRGPELSHVYFRYVPPANASQEAGPGPGTGGADSVS